MRKICFMKNTLEIHYEMLFSLLPFIRSMKYAFCLVYCNILMFFVNFNPKTKIQIFALFFKSAVPLNYVIHKFKSQDVYSYDKYSNSFSHHKRKKEKFSTIFSFLQRGSKKKSYLLFHIFPINLSGSCKQERSSPNSNNYLFP